MGTGASLILTEELNRPDFDGDSTAWRIVGSWQSTAAARSSGGTRPSSGSGPCGWSSRPPASAVSGSAWSIDDTCARIVARGQKVRRQKARAAFSVTRRTSASEQLSPDPRTIAGSRAVGEPAAPAAVVHSVLMTAVRGSGRLAQPIRYSTVTETASSGAPGSVGTDVGSLTAGPAPGAVGGTLFGTIIGTA